ncbi:hypothetical protein V5O48_018481, partial [Marasmius crinis-equi]
MATYLSTYARLYISNPESSQLAAYCEEQARAALRKKQEAENDAARRQLLEPAMRKYESIRKTAAREKRLSQDIVSFTAASVVVVEQLAVAGSGVDGWQV